MDNAAFWTMVGNPSVPPEAVHQFNFFKIEKKTRVE
jgi:hypothetical protein